SEALAKTTARPDISSSRRYCSVARNISRPLPRDTALSLGVTVTGTAAPYAAVIGWRATPSARNAIASPKPAPTTPMATSPALIAPDRTAGSGRRAAAHHAAPAPTASSPPHDANTRPTGHTTPAAVTIQLVSAAGTRRTSSRARAPP